MNNKGVVLIMVLWVLLVLSLIAWGLGRRSSLEVSLLDTYRGKLRSYAAARAGLNNILDLMQRSPSSKDTLYSPGISFDQSKIPADIFAHMDTGQKAYAIVQWPAKNFNTGDSTELEYGLRDEDGRIDLNAIGISNYQILSSLLQLYGLSASEGDKLALAIVNFTGVNAQVSNNNSFMSLNDTLLKPKNKPYENILELLEVNGMTREIFDKIKDDVTVYGETQNGLWVNTDTANNDVIQAVANAAARLDPTINAADIIAQAYAFRDGADGQSFTSDDGAGTLAGNTNANWPAALHEGTSGYYRVRVAGVDGTSGARTVLEAVIQHPAGGRPKIIYWQRD